MDKAVYGPGDWISDIFHRAHFASDKAVGAFPIKKKFSLGFYSPVIHTLSSRTDELLELEIVTDAPIDQGAL